MPEWKANTVDGIDGKDRTNIMKKILISVVCWPLTLLCNFWNNAGGPNYENEATGPVSEQYEKQPFLRASHAPRSWPRPTSDNKISA
jgi:hypothetical protein